MKLEIRLHTKLILTILSIVLIFVVISSYYNISETKNVIETQADVYGNSLAGSLTVFSVDNLLAWDYPAIQQAINDMGAYDSEIIKISVYHNENLVADYSSKEYQQTPGEYCACDKYSMPVVMEILEEKRQIGYVEVTISKKKYEAFLKQKFNSLIIPGIILFIGITLLLYFVLIWIVIRPIKIIEYGIKIIGSGNLNHTINIKSRDEIGKLAKAFNTMTNNLKIARNETEDYKKHLEKKIKERTKELRELNENLEDKVEERTIELKEEENKIAAIITNFFDPIIVTDNDWRINLLNPAAQKILKLSNDNLGEKINTKNKKFFFDNLKNIINLEYNTKVIKTDENDNPIIEEVIFNLNKSDKDGEKKELIYKVLTSPVKDVNGVCYGHMKMFYDLTKEKMIDRLKSEFISISAHQLRTPLSAIKWSLQMILAGEMGEINDEVKEYINKTYKSNERMIALVNDLLNVSRIDEGRYLYNLELIYVKDLIEDVISTSSMTANKNKIKINFKANKRDYKIKADFKKIKLSLQNLIENAIKYSIEGSEVIVNLKQITKNSQKFVQISVKDNGIGIGEKDQLRLFSKFFRAENALRLQTEGSGLGLFIVKNIVEAHGGTIWFKSKENHGSTFYIELPVSN